MRQKLFHHFLRNAAVRKHQQMLLFVLVAVDPAAYMDLPEVAHRIAGYADHENEINDHGTRDLIALLGKEEPEHQDQEV